jgi:hypothetical protein
MKKPYATAIEENLKEALKELSEETLIPQAKLIDVALRDLFKKYGKEVRE